VPSVTTQANITISRKFLHENFTQLSHPKPEKSGTAPQERKVSCGQGSLGTQLTTSEQKKHYSPSSQDGKIHRMVYSYCRFEILFGAMKFEKNTSHCMII
jgi:hypothetical protein